MEHVEGAIDHVARRLATAERVLFVTGAGLSADSGLPTYRGLGGLYEDADTEEGIPIERALSGPMFSARPDVTWRHVCRIEEACRGAEPNDGHRAIAELEAIMKVVVLTQNVDGLHKSGGSTDVIDIHGDVLDLMCTMCSYRERVDSYAGMQVPPRCPDCRGLVRPDVVLFEEMLPVEKLSRLESELARGFDVALSVGTSSLFAYIAGPISHLGARGCLTVEVNPGETEVSAVVDVIIREGAAATLRKIVDRTVALRAS